MSLVPPELVARGPLHVAAYNKAIKEGKNRVMRVPIMFIGQARSGKTSLKKSLKREIFNEEEPSTDGIELDPSYFIVTNDVMSSEETKEQQDVETAVSFHNRAAKFMADEIKQKSKNESSLGKSDRNIVSPNSPKLEDVKARTLLQSEENIAEPAEKQSEKLFETDKKLNTKNRFDKVPKETVECFVKISDKAYREDRRIKFISLSGILVDS